MILCECTELPKAGATGDKELKSEKGKASQRSTRDVCCQLENAISMLEGQESRLLLLLNGFKVLRLSTLAPSMSTSSLHGSFETADRTRPNWKVCSLGQKWARQGCVWQCRCQLSLRYRVLTGPRNCF